MAQHEDDKGFDPGSILDHVTFFRLTQSPKFVDPRAEATWWSVLVELEETSIDQLNARLE